MSQFQRVGTACRYFHIYEMRVISNHVFDYENIIHQIEASTTILIAYTTIKIAIKITIKICSAYDVFELIRSFLLSVR